MRMYDIIAKKRDGHRLAAEEIAYFVKGYTAGEIPDYQAAALMMAIVLRGMDAEETATLTLEMAKSGDMVDLSAVPGVKVDKHSTGGVGDKTSLIVAPLVAACGARVAKMSGRGLGHTGGTIDKLEAIPGLQVELAREVFVQQVCRIGVALVGQSGNLAPADKKMYALRDVTATVQSIPLIASSIMSKKIAAGCDAILLDVKIGTGAFMKTLDEALQLAGAMVDIGEAVGRHTAALVTNMDVPLGCAIGNSLEVAEAVATLQGRGPQDLTQVCLQLAAGMLQLAGQGSHEACFKKAQSALQSGLGFEKLCQMVQAQGGDVRVLQNPATFAKAAVSAEVYAPQGGYIAAMDTEKVGLAAMVLGAGRETKSSRIDPAAGMVLHQKTGDALDLQQPLATLYAETDEKLQKGKEMLLSALRIEPTPPPPQPLVLARVDKTGVHRLNG